MSEHTLPDDLARWPVSPFKLLGVSPGVNERDLRRAYTYLIRTYKPEHFPEHFRRIREAFEAARKQVPIRPAFEAPAERPAPLPTESPSPRKQTPAPPKADLPATPVVDRPAPPAPPRSFERELDEAWNWAVNGDEARAYACLLDLQNRYPKRSEIYLRLYSLLLVAAELDNRRRPCDFLVQELRQTGGGGPCHELYRREIEDNPAEALTLRFGELLQATTQPGLLSIFVRWRWSAAGRLKRFEVIGAGLPELRQRLAAEQEEIWLRLLAFAADQLAWTVAPIKPFGLAECVKEVFSHKHLQLRFPAVFDRLEYLDGVAKGWRSLMKKRAAPADFLNLLSQFWTRPFPTIRRDVTALLAAIDAKTQLWLSHLDRINQAAPQVLSIFGQMLDAHKQTLVLEADERDAEELTLLARNFLEEHSGLRYTTALRPRLLAFSLRERIEPDVISRLAVNRTVALPQARLNKLVNDRALRNIYRACTLFRN
jgi:hypothetical protein